MQPRARQNRRGGPGFQQNLCVGTYSSMGSPCWVGTQSSLSPVEPTGSSRSMGSLAGLACKASNDRASGDASHLMQKRFQAVAGLLMQ